MSLATARARFAAAMTGKCNSDKCHCPRCRPCLEDRVDRIDDRVSRLERNERLEALDRVHRAASLGRIRKEASPWRNKVYYSRATNECWKWELCGPRYWIKAKCDKAGNLIAGRIGPLYDNVAFGDYGYSARAHLSLSSTRPEIYDCRSRSVNSDIPLPAVSAVEHIETEKVGVIERTVTDRTEFAIDDEFVVNAREVEIDFLAIAKEVAQECAQPGEKIMLSPLELSILLWRAANITANCVYPAAWEVNLRGALRDLEVKKLIRLGLDGNSYDLTDRAKVFIERGLAAVPLPVQQPAPWIMPTKV